MISAASKQFKTGGAFNNRRDWRTSTRRELICWWIPARINPKRSRPTKMLNTGSTKMCFQLRYALKIEVLIQQIYWFQPPGLRLVHELRQLPHPQRGRDRRGGGRRPALQRLSDEMRPMCLFRLRWENIENDHVERG